MMRAIFGLVLAFTLIGSAAMAVEEPPFEMVVKDGDFELRDYPALIAAEVSVKGYQNAAASAGFRLLAGYIFGGNVARTKIAMTAPVVQAAPASQKIAMTAPVTQVEGPQGWTVRFIMPRGYTLDTLPKPNDDRVVLKSTPPVRLAVLRFSGVADAKSYSRSVEALDALISARRLKPLGPPSLAQYDPPWTLWFLRRNEVMRPVAVDAPH